MKKTSPSVEIKPALEPDDNSLVLWAESPAEAEHFVKRFDERGYHLPLQYTFVAKRSPTYRHNSYINGVYYRTSGFPNFDVYNDVVLAPKQIIDLVNWCTCDIMLSYGSRPLVVVEDTTHIVRMNLYQRIPRLARAAMLGSPSLMLQGTRGLNFRLRGDRWALHRYLQAFDAIARVYPEAPCLPLTYSPDSADEVENAEKFIIEHVEAALHDNSAKIAADRDLILSDVRRILTEGVNGQNPPDINSIDYRGREVIVRIGAKPDRPSWETKGSGQMDPYIGLIAAAKYIYCYNREGIKTKDLVVEFTYLPPNFKFFNNPQPTALYKRLPFEIADRVVFLG